MILTVNGGSSTIKYGLFDGPETVARGKIEASGGPAVDELAAWVAANVDVASLRAVAHRVVHGGPKFSGPARLDAAAIAELRRISPYDPEHLPEEIHIIERLLEALPNVPHFACFDTAFHHDLPMVARVLPIPREFEGRGVRRYGFHGISCQSIMGQLSDAERAGRVVIAHLGSGASITAVLAGRSIDTSMSFTPVAGIPMSTRCGDLDPGLAWYLQNVEKVDAKAFHEMIHKRSGLLGVSGVSGDVRVLLESTVPAAREAVELFCYQVRKTICAMAGALGGIDTLVFSGGIGENSAQVRAWICEGMEWMGIRLDAAGSAVKVRVVRTDEERQMAVLVRELL
ncbi:acetate kinase [Bryobacterales bacterium F-183]|nr:acetate kinase [Bryobacterales bacterium F-183]